MDISLRHCYDFPLAILHSPTCPRYRGGVCHPKPQPNPPMTDEEKAVTEAYEEGVKAAGNPTDGATLHNRLMAKVRTGNDPLVKAAIRPSGITGDIKEDRVH